MTFLIVALVASLVALVAAHVALVVGLARLRPHVWWRTALSIVLPPLAPYWGFRHGLRVRTFAWLAAIAVYALGVAIA